MANVGGKIKTLVAVVTVIGLIACVLLFFVGNSAYQEDKDYLEYATVNGGAYGYPTLQRAGDNAYNGLQMRKMALPLAISILVGALPLYGFGVLVEGSEQRTLMLSQLLEEQKKTNEYLRKAEVTAADGENKSSAGNKKSVSSYLPEL